MTFKTQFTIITVVLGPSPPTKTKLNRREEVEEAERGSTVYRDNVLLNFIKYLINKQRKKEQPVNMLPLVGRKYIYIFLFKKKKHTKQKEQHTHFTSHCSVRRRLLPCRGDEYPVRDLGEQQIQSRSLKILIPFPTVDVSNKTPRELLLKGVYLLAFKNTDKVFFFSS